MSQTRIQTGLCQTAVTWNGQAFEPMLHESYLEARAYVAEFVAFHGTEQGASSRLVGPDSWQIVVDGSTLSISIRRV